MSPEKMLDSECVFNPDAATERTLKNIKKTLLASLEKYDAKEKLSEILKTHGLHKNNFDYISCIENTINNKISDISIDDNSNKEEKTIEAIHQEVFGSVKKAIGYDMLYRTMKKMYGKEDAKRLSGQLYDFSLMFSDSTNALKVYCFSINASAITTVGRNFGQLHSKPSKRVSSYISALSETVHQLASHLAGAVAVGSFFLDIAHIMIYKQKTSLDALKGDAKVRKNLENEMQQFVHSVNHLSRSSIESPFSNISIFDKPKLFAMIEDMSWYFPEENGIDNKYIVDYITELQNVFLDFFDKGDPSANNRPYRFPVVTVVMSKNKDGEIVDQEMLENITHREIYRYNIFVSEGTRTASCCRLLSDSDMLQHASQSNSFGGAAISLGSHRVVTINLNRIALEQNDTNDKNNPLKCTEQDTNNPLFCTTDNTNSTLFCQEGSTNDTQNGYFHTLSQRIEDTAKILSAHKELIKLTNDKGLQMFIRNGWIAMSRLFSTFGILGLVEAAETMTQKGLITDKDAFKGDVLRFINTTVSEMSKKYGIIGNIEQIPAESMAVKAAKIDRVLFGSRAVPYKMYSNQFVPLWEDATIWERLEADGKFNQLITGGGIVHAQIGERVTPAQARKIVEYAVSCGCEHFALNAVYSECVKGHVHLGKTYNCKECGDKVKDHMTRVVGFFTRVSAWNPTRRDWEFDKRTFVNLKDSE